METPNVELTFDQAVASGLDEELLSDSLAALAAIPGLGNVQLVLAGDLTEAVKCRLSPEEGAGFRADRVTGSVGAKTLYLENGEPCIVMSARLLVPGAAAAEVDVPRLFAHEGWHVAIYGRGEDFLTLFKRLTLSQTEAILIGQALILLEEFRVERALDEQGMQLYCSYDDSTIAVFAELTLAMRDAITLRYVAEPIDRTMDSAVRAFNAFTIHFAYLAADHVTSNGRRTIGAAVTSDGWSRYVGTHWNALVDVLEPIPSAAHEMTFAQLEAAARQVAEVLRAWLQHIGFDLYVLPNGDGYFDVLRHDF